MPSSKRVSVAVSPKAVVTNFFLLNLNGTTIAKCITQLPSRVRMGYSLRKYTQQELTRIVRGLPLPTLPRWRLDYLNYVPQDEPGHTLNHTFSTFPFPPLLQHYVGFLTQLSGQPEYDPGPYFAIQVNP